MDGCCKFKEHFHANYDSNFIVEAKKIILLRNINILLVLTHQVESNNGESGDGGMC